MATREELYRRFGPCMVEALMDLVVDEINILRTNDGLPTRTKQQILNALENKLDNTPLYDWMNT